MENNTNSTPSTSQGGNISSAQAQILRTILCLLVVIFAASSASAQYSPEDYIEIDDDIKIDDPTRVPPVYEPNPLPSARVQIPPAAEDPVDERNQEQAMPAPFNGKPKGENAEYNNPQRSGTECAGLEDGKFKHMYSQFTKIYMEGGKGYAVYPVYTYEFVDAESVDEFQDDQSRVQPRMAQIPQYRRVFVPARRCVVGRDYCGWPIVNYIPAHWETVFVGHAWVPQDAGQQIPRRNRNRRECVALQFQRTIELNGARNLRDAKTLILRKKDQITERAYAASDAPTPADLGPISETNR